MIRQHTISPPLIPLPGDTFAVVAGVLEQRRGGMLIAFRNLGSGSPMGQAAAIGSPIVTLYLETSMPGQIATLTNVIRNPTTGVVRFQFSSNTEREFASQADALTAVEYLDLEPGTCEDALILRTLRSSPDGSDLTNQVGSSCSSDFNANTPIVLTEGN